MSAVLRKVVIKKSMQRLGSFLTSRGLDMVFILLFIFFVTVLVWDLFFKAHLNF